ncbi:hemolysin family protein [bacterium]|nr:hemolysin family protein [bacterium]
MSEEILIVIALVLSAFFSGTETAYTVSGRLAMEVYKRHNRPGAKVASRLYANPTLLFNTTLVGNNLVGVLYASVTAVWLDRIGVPVEWIFVISPTIVLIFGEILPKTFARETAERWALRAGGPLWISRILFAPLILITRASSSLLLRAFGMRDENRDFSTISLGDLTGVWGQLHTEGSLDAEEKELLDHAVALRDVKMREIMTPRADVVALPVEATIEEAEHLVSQRGYTRIPVFEGNIDNVVGVLLAQELLGEPETLQSILREPKVVPEQAYANRFLHEFRRGEVGLAIVIDEHGGTAGVVTLEDFLERLVGAIEDEHDPQAMSGRKVSNDSWLVSGRASLELLRDKWGIKLPDGDYETVAGWLLDELDRIPDPGEFVDVGRWRVRVVATDPRRIKRVLIRKMQTRSAKPRISDRK